MKDSYNHNDKRYPRYEAPSDESLLESLNSLQGIFVSFCKMLKLDSELFSVDGERIIEAFIRVDQRKLHYKMYHNGTKLNEPKEAAILAYWISRFKPFTCKFGDCYYTRKYNELFSLFLIDIVVASYRNIRKMPKLILTKNIRRDLLYTIENRSTTFDDMALMVDSLAHVMVKAA
ncbi:MAG: hypothetical protein FWE27_04880 [Defluviitaleaceae bacterium]|nr:hypothetical protein [Defluviitaleaceae bacterium]